jgi:putative nucleotidyltransferase with HDIG domain
MNREEAYILLKKYIQSESLLKHALAVEGAMIGYAKKLGEDVEKWSITGLVHDIDYEKYPEEHPLKGVEILSEEGFDEEIVYAVKGHADYTGTERKSNLDRGLYSVDELASFIVACALVRPTRSFEDLEVKSVRKKLKDKGFAKAVDRDIIHAGAEAFGIELSEHISNMISFLKERERELNKGGLSLIN